MTYIKFKYVSAKKFKSYKMLKKLIQKFHFHMRRPHNIFPKTKIRHKINIYIRFTQKKIIKQSRSPLYTREQSDFRSVFIIYRIWRTYYLYCTHSGGVLALFRSFFGTAGTRRIQSDVTTNKFDIPCVNKRWKYRGKTNKPPCISNHPANLPFEN